MPHTLDLGKKPMIEDLDKMSMAEGIHFLIKKPQYPKTCFICDRPHVNHFTEIYIGDKKEWEEMAKHVEEIHKIYQSGQRPDIRKLKESSHVKLSICCLCLDNFFITRFNEKFYQWVLKEFNEHGTK